MFDRLDKNIQAVIAEQQIKLGYLEEKIRLYYPLASLNGLLETECTSSQMRKILDDFSADVEEKYGKIVVTEKEGRFCFLLPSQAGKYVHEHMGDFAFLKELIEMVAGHGHSFEDVLSVFRKYSDCVHVEPVDYGEFDYLVYFQDGEPDDFIYCISVEGRHITYHRFTKADYESFEW